MSICTFCSSLDHFCASSWLHRTASRSFRFCRRLWPQAYTSSNLLCAGHGIRSLFQRHIIFGSKQIRTLNFSPSPSHSPSHSFTPNIVLTLTFICRCSRPNNTTYSHCYNGIRTLHHHTLRDVGHLRLRTPGLRYVASSLPCMSRG
jgi:hypothetical protein